MKTENNYLFIIILFVLSMMFNGYYLIQDFQRTKIKQDIIVLQIKEAMADTYKDKVIYQDSINTKTKELFLK